MKTREMERALGAADPVGRGRLDRIDLEAMEADLLADLDADLAALSGLEPARPRRRRRRRLVLALGSAVLAVALAALIVLTGGGSDHPSRAYGAELVRFAESTPLLLLEGPGWRVQNVFEQEGGEGSMEFVTGGPIPYESIDVTGNVETGQYQSGIAPAAIRQRKVELAWSHRNLAETLAAAHQRLHSHGEHWVEAPVLDTTAHVDTRDEVFVNEGGRRSPDDRLLVRRRLPARTEGGGPRPGRLRRTPRMAGQRRFGDLARRDAGESRQGRRP